MIRSILMLVVIVGATSLAGAQSLEQAAGEAAALTAATKAKIEAAGPCGQSPALDAASFVVRFPAGAPKGGAAEYTVHFGSCEIEDYYYGEPIEPRAIRRYFTDDQRYGLVLTTEWGADSSSIDVSGLIAGYQQRLGYVGEGKNRDLLSVGASFKAAQVMDIEGIGGTMRPRDVTVSPAETAKKP
ncbi:MAG: hypothetical protein ACHQ2Z_10125 [Elusimicrobiota bacterium]